jgi:hypothetical protein
LAHHRLNDSTAEDRHCLVSLQLGYLSKDSLLYLVVLLSGRAGSWLLQEYSSTLLEALKQS